MAKRSMPPTLIIVGIVNILIALPCMCCLGANAAILASSSGKPGAKPAANDPMG